MVMIVIHRQCLRIPTIEPNIVFGPCAGEVYVFSDIDDVRPKEGNKSASFASDLHKLFGFR